MSIEKFKSHFAENKFINLNNAGMGKLPDVNRDKAMEWIERFYREGSLCAIEALKKSERTRELIAEIFGAHKNEVGFFLTTASAVSQAAFSAPLAKGDEILTWDQEYPSNFYPWRVAAERSGARLVQIESQNWQTPAEAILNRVDKNTKVIAVSWVQFQTGAVTDLRLLSEKLRGTGIWLVADIIQGAGIRPFDFHESGFDVACCGSHKWLCSGFGAAFMLVKPSRLAEMAAVEVGAGTYGDFNTPKSFTVQPKTDASKFEPGSKPIIELLGMGATLELFKQTGVEAIFKESCRLADRFRAGLQAIGGGDSRGDGKSHLRENSFALLSTEGPIVTFLPPAKINIEDVFKKLEAAQISFAKRASGVRLSFHAYNTDAEVDRALEVLS